MLRKNVDEKVFKDLPPFPKKKLIGGMDAAFLSQRMTELGHFFNALLSKPKAASSALVLTYFAGRRADKASE